MQRMCTGVSHVAKACTPFRPGKQVEAGVLLARVRPGGLAPALRLLTCLPERSSSATSLRFCFTCIPRLLRMSLIRPRHRRHCAVQSSWRVSVHSSALHHGQRPESHAGREHVACLDLRCLGFEARFEHSRLGSVLCPLAIALYLWRPQVLSNFFAHTSNALQ